MSPKEAWLDHWFKPGWLSELIYSEHSTNPEPNPDLESVIHAFRNRNAHSVIDAIELCIRRKREGRELIEFGSGSINIGKKEELTPESFAALQELYIGNRKRKITPIAWFGYLSRHIEKVPEQVLVILDGLCREFVRIDTMLESGHYEEAEED